jgi:S-adenosylmethionine synthetase
MGIYVNTYGTARVNFSDGEIARKIDDLFDMRPAAIENRLKLRNPIYRETAAYGHMGRKYEKTTKKFHSDYFGDKEIEVELFTWEQLDMIDGIKEAFGL